MKNQLIHLSFAAFLIAPAVTAQNTFPFPATGPVGIGTANPPTKLSVVGGGELGAPSDGGDKSATLLLGSTNGRPEDGGQIEFGYGVGSYAQPYFAAIKGLGISSTGNTQGDLAFYTRATEAASSLTERVRVTKDGRVGIGTTEPTKFLDVNGDARVNGWLFVEAPADSAPRVQSSRQLVLQTLNNQDLLLNPFDGGGNVVVGGAVDSRNLIVKGKVTTQSLELTSDRNVKCQFAPIVARNIIAKVAALPITAWSYTNSPTVRHLGPMAQDFKAAFGLGEDDKHIGAGDGIGVALAAIKGLHEMLQEKDSEIAALKRELAGIKQELAGVKENVTDRLAALEKSMTRNVKQAVNVRPNHGFTSLETETAQVSLSPESAR